MKSKKGILDLMLLISITVLLYGCQVLTTQEELSRVLDVDCDMGYLVFEEDSHGGFHNDGIQFVQLTFESSDLEEDIKLSSSWKPLPLSDDLLSLCYETNVDGRNTQARLSNEEGKPYFPIVEEGYYYFTGGVNSHSANFVIAIFDRKTNTLYYGKYDS